MKRVFDIVLVLLAAPLWLPLLALTALAVLLVEGRPVFFAQTRAGLHGRPFRIVKFRSMRTGAGSDAERLGITGWAQVHGRNALEWEARFAHDVWYVDHRSLWLDIKILFLTIGAVFAARGISEKGEATMSTFTGT